MTDRNYFVGRLIDIGEGLMDVALSGIIAGDISNEYGLQRGSQEYLEIRKEIRQEGWDLILGRNRVSENVN